MISTITCMHRCTAIFFPVGNLEKQSLYIYYIYAAYILLTVKMQFYVISSSDLHRLAITERYK